VLSAVTGWTLFAGLALSLGAVASRWLIIPRGFPQGDPPGARLREEAARVGQMGGLLLMLGLSLFFVRQLIEFRDPFSAWVDEATLLLGTSWGRSWMVAGVASVVGVASLSVARRRDHGWRIATPIVLALGAFPALTGHAAAEERFRALYILADVAHVWGAGAWIGGLAVVLWLEWRSSSGAESRASLLPALVPAFSTVAIGAVGALVVTGTFASWTHLPSPGALFTTTYGRLLAAKLGLVALVLALGARNFRVLTPRLGTEGGNRAMRRSALFELAVAQIVLIVTALLVRTSPMGG